MAGGAWLIGVMNSAKKSETIEVRLPFAAKRAFAERCRAEGLTMSDAIRRFVKGPQPARRGLTGPLAVTAAIALAVAVSPAASRQDHSADFAALDRNKDGVVTRAEVPSGGAGCPAPLALPLKRSGLGNGPRHFATCRDEPDFAMLDRDGDGLATRHEFAARRVALLRQGYDALDRDGDGSLDAAEYAAASKIVFLGEPPALARFGDLDGNGDRRIAFGEYLR